MESVLIVSNTAKNINLFKDLLKASSINYTAVLDSASEARRLLLERDFDLVIADSPLHDESGESFSRQVATKGISQVILVVTHEFYDEVSSVCEADGVLVISKPVNKTVFGYALSLAKSARNIRMHEQAGSARLKQKIEDIRLVNKAKYLLITHLNISEQEAHRFIEKQAMDLRTTKRAVAERILKTYGN